MYMYVASQLQELQLYFAWCHCIVQQLHVAVLNGLEVEILTISKQPSLLTTNIMNWNVPLYEED